MKETREHRPPPPTLLGNPRCPLCNGLVGKFSKLVAQSFRNCPTWIIFGKGDIFSDDRCVSYVTEPGKVV